MAASGGGRRRAAGLMVGQGTVELSIAGA